MQSLVKITSGSKVVVNFTRNTKYTATWIPIWIHHESVRKRWNYVFTVCTAILLSPRIQICFSFCISLMLFPSRFLACAKYKINPSSLALLSFMLRIKRGKDEYTEIFTELIINLYLLANVDLWIYVTYIQFPYCFDPQINMSKRKQSKEAVRLSENKVIKCLSCTRQRGNKIFSRSTIMKC